MRILHVTDHYLPVLGGIETQVAALAARQAARGDDVTVLTSTPASVDGQHLEDTGPVQVHRARSLLVGAQADLASYDLVQAHVSVLAPFSSPLAALAARRGVPTVVTVHSLWKGLGPVASAAASLAGLRTAPVQWTAVSRVAAEQLARRLPTGTHVAVVPNAVEVTPRQWTPVPAPGDPVRLVSTMRIARRKRPYDLLSMFAALQRSTATDVTLTIVGDGPQRPGLESRIRRAGLREAVSVTGRLSPQDVLQTLAGADVYVAPAVLESFGLAALEARCVGLPVVGHAASGVTEFVRDGVEGRLCGSDAEMVSQLRGLVDDDGLRHRISEHNRSTPSTLTWANAMATNDEAHRLACLVARAPRGAALRAATER